MAEINVGAEPPEGKIARALRELNKHEQTEELPVPDWAVSVEPEEPCTIEFQKKIRCDTIADVRIYLFGMRDVLDATPDNDYEQGQLSVINKLLDVTREDS